MCDLSDFHELFFLFSHVKISAMFPLTAMGNPNWRYYYFGENYQRLSQIKLKYDPLNFFGNPQQVEPAVTGKNEEWESKSGKIGKKELHI